MRRRYLAWPRLTVAAVLAAMIGAGAWLAVGAGGSSAADRAPGPAAAPSASAGALPKLNLAALPSAPPAPRPAGCRPLSLAGASGVWLPDWFEDPGLASLVPEQAQRLGVLDFFWLSLGSSADSIQERPGNPGGAPLASVLDAAATANPCGWRFVTVSDEQAPKATMARILLNPQARWRNVTALATAMASLPQANGLTLDYEYALPSSQQDLDRYASVAGWHGLGIREQINRITAGYTEFVRELALAMHRQHRALRVAVKVRATDEISYADLSSLSLFVYDYGQLSKYADQIVLMAIDFHWSTGDPGPIVTMSDLTKVLDDVRTYRIPAARLAVESPVYGYDWTVGRAGHILAGTQASSFTATDLASRAWRKTGSKDGETSYGYTAGGKRHVVWFGGSALAYQTTQVRRLYPGIAIMAWATGNTDPAGSRLILQALGK
ncbi:MAG: glycosyl hydrolase family 18 protein [Gemmatimonadota bacterium]